MKKQNDGVYPQEDKQEEGDLVRMQKFKMNIFDFIEIQVNCEMVIDNIKKMPMENAREHLNAVKMAFEPYINTNKYANYLCLQLTEIYEDFYTLSRTKIKSIFERIYKFIMTDVEVLK